MKNHRITLFGNLGRDPEMRYMPNGNGVTAFSVAVDDSFTKDGQKTDRTIWIRCSAFGKLAETCNQYLKKGNKVYIEGQLQSDTATGGPRTWEKDGKTNASFEVTVADVKFLTPKQGGAEPQPAEDLPF